MSSIGFRPTPEDNEIIQAHKRSDESTSDVLRRALRALDRERWNKQAREDMERIAASGEDLSDEPDDWGFDEDERPVDLRGRRDMFMKASDRRSARVVAAFDWALSEEQRMTLGHFAHSAKVAFGYSADVTPVVPEERDLPRAWWGPTHLLGSVLCVRDDSDIARILDELPPFEVIPAALDPETSTGPHVDERASHVSAKLARLHAARRRATKR